MSPVQHQSMMIRRHYYCRSMMTMIDGDYPLQLYMIVDVVGVIE
jgi:hypothetical protein